MGKGKVTKRERKFQASGGVKSRIKKGTITKKGKLRMRKKGGGQNPGTGSSSATTQNNTRRENGGAAATSSSTTASMGRAGILQDLGRSNDFLGERNLAGLDLDSFFAHASEEIENFGNDNDSDDDSQDDDDSNSESDGSSEDDEGEDGEDKAASKERPGAGSSSSDDDDDSSEDSGSDDDDEDVEKAEARMKKQMASMERSDPSFHQFLKENEGSLLEFGEDDDDEDDNEDEDASEVGDDENQSGEDDHGKAKERASRSKDTENVLTHKALEALLRSAFDAKGIKGLKKLVGGAYRSACHLSDAADGDGAAARVRPGESGTPYRIESSKVFDDLMVSCLGRCHEAFRYHLLEASTAGDGDEVEEGGDNDSVNPTDENKPINPKTLENSARWADIKPILLSFFRSTLHLLLEAKEPKLLTLILRALAKYVPLLSPFPHVASSALKALLQLWSAPLEASEDYQVVRLNSFLRIRQLALTQPFPFIEECMKRSYHSYASRAKFGASSSLTGLPTLTFMGNCIVELYSLDYHSAYQHAFVYIRQLALLLRGALINKSTDNVYCWQYVHSLKLWTAVLSASAAQDDGTLLRSLVYPLTEVVLGTVRLSPSPRYLPLRLQCVRLLQQLAAATETFVPTAALVLDCLDYKEWYLPPKKSQSSPRSLQMDLTLRLPSTDKQPCLRTREQLDPAMAEIMVVLQHEVELYRYNPGFPEYAVGIEQRLRKFVRETREMRWKAFARGVVDVAERYSSVAVQGRSQLKEAPRDVRELECLRPVDQPSMRERLQSLLDKERKASAASGGAGAVAPSAKKGASHKRGHRANDDDNREDEDERKIQPKDNKKQKHSKASDPKASVSAKKQAGGKVAGRGSKGSNVDDEDEVHEGIDWSDDDDDE